MVSSMVYGSNFKQVCTNGVSEIGDNFRFVHGLAIRNTAIKPSTYDDRLSGAVWDACRDPCPNCRELLSLRHGDPTQFAKENGSEGAPP